MDHTISSPLLKAKTGKIWHKYNSVEEAVIDGDWNAVSFLIRSGHHIRCLDDLCYDLAKRGKCVQDLLERGIKDYENIAYGASRGGHLDIVESMIELGCQCYEAIAYGAARCGHLKIIERMIELGPRDYSAIYYRAMQHGHPEIVEWLVENKYI